MISTIKTQSNILSKLNIEQLNGMQEEAISVIATTTDVVLLSPTGSGKTVAFLLPIIADLDTTCTEIQVLILVPTRELAMQIEQVVREMGTGYKVNAVYGGRAGSKDKIDLKHRPAILIGTPGRVADRIFRDSFSTEFITTLVLDEFDKSLEIGFENEMREIIEGLPNIKKRILTSATQKINIPEFVGLQHPKYINYLEEGISQLKVKIVVSPTKDKLGTLLDTLCHIGNEPGIIFCNFKDTIQEVSDFLTQNHVAHGCFFGGMEQIDRERALMKFRNGTHQLLIATDLAARGLDIPELKFIIHFQLPNRNEEFIHRNGRTARMNNDGTAYVLKCPSESARAGKNELLPDFIKNAEMEELKTAPIPSPSKWVTAYISGGRKDKISKGDIAGWCCKQGNLTQNEIGLIEIKQDCAFVAIHSKKATQLVQLVDNSKLKTKKVRVTII